MIFQVARASIRSIVRRPVHRLAATLILALGLAAAISVFTYLNGFNRGVPGADPDGLVQLFAADDQSPFLDISFPDYLDYAGSMRGLRSIGAVQSYYAASVRLEDLTVVAFLDAVAGSYFQVLGVEASIGRTLTAEDDRPEAEPRAVISHSWWKNQFGGDPNILGSTIFLNYRPHTVVGVLSPKFAGSASDSRPHVWIPVSSFRSRYTSWDALALDRDVPLVRVYARLAPEVSRVRAEEEVRRVAQGLDQAYPIRGAARRVHLQPATWIDPRTRLAEESTNRIILLASWGFLLLVCANVANLLLSVSLSRERETALMGALGASRARLGLGILMENAILALGAGGLALGIALPASTRLGSYFARPSIWGANVPREFSLDLRVVGFAALVSLMTGLLAGALPALRSMRPDVMNVLRSGPTTGMARGRILGFRAPGLKELLTSTQVALSVALLAVSGLVLKTLATAEAVDPGFGYENLIGSHISTSSTSLLPEERERFFRDVEEQIALEPWVESATVAGSALLSGHGSLNLRVAGEGESTPTLVSSVHDGFFEKLGVELVSGRTFSSTDTLGAPVVAVLNRPAAERFFPAGAAVSGSLWTGTPSGESRELAVVGVVGDIKVRDFLSPPEPVVFLHYAQQAYPTGSALLVNTRGSPELAVPMLHGWLRDFEPHLAIVNAISYKDVVRGALYTQRMNAELFSILGSFGLLLAALGIFSVVSLSVSRRTREIGVRKAVGASRRTIHGLVVREAMGPVVVGLAMGLAASLALAGLVETLLYGVEPSDPVGWIGGSLTLLLIAGIAAYLPGRRASGADPMKVLRAE